jgi:hypothetical protein
MVLIAILIVLACLVTIVYLYFKERAYEKRRAGMGDKRRIWKVDEVESERHPITSIHLVLGDRREYYGSVNRMDTDYEDALYNLRASAEDEVVERNAIRRTITEERPTAKTLAESE